MGTTKRRMRTALAICVLLGATTGCGDDNEPTPATQAQGDQEPATNTVQVAATEYAFDMPTEVKGGVVSLELTNEGAEHHEFAFGRLDDGVAIEEVLEAMEKRKEHDGSEDLAGVPLLSPGERATMTRTLEPGTYFFLCMFPTPDFTPHAARGMHATFDVEGDAGASPPEPDATIVARGDGFEVPELEAGTQTIEFRNDGSGPHEFLIYGATDAGATDKDFEKWMGQGQKGDPPLVFPGGMQSIEPGTSILQTITLESGLTYRLQDFTNKLEATIPIP